MRSSFGNILGPVYTTRKIYLYLHVEQVLILLQGDNIPHDVNPLFIRVEGEDDSGRPFNYSQATAYPSKERVENELEYQQLAHSCDRLFHWLENKVRSLFLQRYSDMTYSLDARSSA